MILKIKGKSCGLDWGISIITILFIAVINPSARGAYSPPCDWRTCMMPNIWGQCVSYCEPGLSCCNGICYNPLYSICCSNFTCSITSQCCGSSHCCSQGWQCCPDGCCPDGYSCCGEHCCNSDLCQECVNGQCQVCSGRPGEFCCNGSCCNLLDCKICFEGNCMFYCEQENCEECIDGECKVCGDREYEACCGGQCYNINTHGCCDDKTVYDLDGNECCHAGNGKVCNHWLDLFCCGGDCWNWKTQECCWDAGYGYVIDKGKICCNGQSCDPCECESCVDDVCVVCGDNSNQKCCEGSCCDKVWKTRTVTSLFLACSPCGSGGGEGLCGGNTLEYDSYLMCDNVGVGQGEHCGCTNTIQEIGNSYPCRPNWDVSAMIWCAAHTGWCAFECAVSGFDPAACGNCLAGINCCGGPCEICDFVEECEKNPYYPDPQETLVFSKFDC